MPEKKPIWVKLKVFAPFDSISNPGTKYKLEGGKTTVVNPNGSEPFSIRKGQFVPINEFSWDDVIAARKELKWNKKEGKYDLDSKTGVFAKYDPDVFEFYKTRKEAQKQVEKEKSIVAKLPEYRLQKKRERVQWKKDNGKQSPASREEIEKEAKEIGADIPNK